LLDHVQSTLTQAVEARPGPTRSLSGARILLREGLSDRPARCPVSAIPVIDIAPLVSGSPEQARVVARDLGRACRDVGFFYLSGHGVPPALIVTSFLVPLPPVPVSETVPTLIEPLTVSGPLKVSVAVETLV